MYRIIYIFVLFLSATGWCSAQDDIQDPVAQDILDKVSQRIDNYRSLEVRFNIFIEVPQSEMIERKGQLIQQGRQFVMNTGDQEIFCDGKYIWIYQPEINEVQWNNFDPDEEGALNTPLDYLRMYKTGEYEYAMTNYGKEDGVDMNYIEFKPKDKYSEFSKVRLSITRATNELYEARAFYKDGTRITLEMVEMNPNLNFEEGDFTFNKTNYPGVYIEDLRID